MGAATVIRRFPQKALELFEGNIDIVTDAFENGDRQKGIHVRQVKLAGFRKGGRHSPENVVPQIGKTRFSRKLAR
ncbi:hypothetical protein AB5J62_15660 [Amycolatopsis sp. cg5]|uniref:hypothetical protein n=1 Tax=Amycolatopsis sp. cg5 TaxID=3238802 RepID=UPI0035264735